MVGAYWGVGSWWVPVFVVCRGAWLLCGVGALGCLVNLGGACVAVLLRPGDVLGCGAAWGVLLGSGGVLAEACGVIHVFWWCCGRWLVV